MLSNLILKSFEVMILIAHKKPFLEVGEGLPFSLYIRMFHVNIGTISWKKVSQEGFNGNRTSHFSKHCPNKGLHGW